MSGIYREESEAGRLSCSVALNWLEFLWNWSEHRFLLHVVLRRCHKHQNVTSLLCPTLAACGSPWMRLQIPPQRLSIVCEPKLSRLCAEAGQGQDPEGKPEYKPNLAREIRLTGLKLASASTFHSTATVLYWNYWQLSQPLLLLTIQQLFGWIFPCYFFLIQWRLSSNLKRLLRYKSSWYGGEWERQGTDWICVYGWENYWNEQEMSSGKIQGGRGKKILF